MGTVYDWKYYCTDAQFCNVVLYNNDTGEQVFEGLLSEAPYKYLNYEVQSFDPVWDECTKLCLNIGL